MSRNFFNLTSRNQLQPDIIFEYEDETTILCYLDPAERRVFLPDTAGGVPDVRELACWSIVKITVVETAGVKTYERKFPNGDRRFDFKVSEIANYSFDFPI
jgi:hypothetical protein